MIPPTRSFASPLEVLQREFDRAFSRAGDFFAPNSAEGGFPVETRAKPKILQVDGRPPPACSVVCV